MSRPLTWMYRKLGWFYPGVFVTLELQTAFPIALGAVALFSFYYDVDRSDFLLIAGITLALTALSVLVVLLRTYPRLRPLAAWIKGDRGAESTAQAWRVAVGLPMTLIRKDFFAPVLITVPVVVSAMLILGLTWIAFFPIMVAALITIGYAAMLHYLALEIAMRPVLFDINAALEAPLRIDRPSVPLRYKLMASLPLINVITGMTVAALTSEGGGGIGALSVNVLIALAIAFAVSFELTVLLSRSILRPVEDLEAATERIRQGRFDEHVPVTTADEFGELSSAFNQMVDGLAERERLREAFGTYLDEEVASYIISEGYDPTGAELEVSLLFCDVQNFSTAAAEASAHQVVSRLNELFECVVPIISRHRGHVDQFIGDGLLAVFGAPERVTDHADRAVQCAVEVARVVNSRRPGDFEVGIGVNSGKVVAGSIGGAGRLSFSVIGDAVNIASRVEAITRETGDPVLITAETRALLSETMEVEQRGEYELRGSDRTVELYAPLIPVAAEQEQGGLEISEPGSLGQPSKAGDGLGLRGAAGLGRSTGGSGLGRPSGGGRSGPTHTLPG
jgi:adenylate cyclase